MSFGALTFTPLVKKLQERYGSRRQYERMEGSGAKHDHLGASESAFLSERDSFYWATTGATGWPYVQHRGGPKGFRKVIDDRTLALADFRGNSQYTSTGNLLSDNRVAMILVNYPRQTRLKILGRIDIFEGEKAEGWLDRVRIPGYKAVIERVFVIHVKHMTGTVHNTLHLVTQQKRFAMQGNPSKSGCANWKRRMKVCVKNLLSCAPVEDDAEFATQSVLTISPTISFVSGNNWADSERISKSCLYGLHCPHSRKRPQLKRLVSPKMAGIRATRRKSLLPTPLTHAGETAPSL